MKLAFSFFLWVHETEESNDSECTLVLLTWLFLSSQQFYLPLLVMKTNMVEKTNNIIVLIRLECKTWNHKLREENTGVKLLDSGLDNDFLDVTPKGKVTKARINKWDYNKLKASEQQRKSLTEWKDNLPNGRKYLQIIYLLRG